MVWIMWGPEVHYLIISIASKWESLVSLYNWGTSQPFDTGFETGMSVHRLVAIMSILMSF